MKTVEKDKQSVNSRASKKQAEAGSQYALGATSQASQKDNMGAAKDTVFNAGGTGSGSRVGLYTGAGSRVGGSMMPAARSHVSGWGSK